LIWLLSAESETIPFTPDRSEYLFSCNRSISVAREKDKEVEYLGFNRNPFTRFPKLEVGGVEFEVAEANHMRRDGVHPKVDAICLDGPADILHRLLAKGYETHRNIGTDMVMDLLRRERCRLAVRCFQDGTPH